MNKIILIILLLLVLLCCNLGVESGDDLVGKWKAIDGNTKSDYHIKNNGEGYFDIDYESTSQLTRYMEWEVTSSSSSIYKYLTIEKRLSENDRLLDTYEYYYYFNADKTKLYMRNIEDADNLDSWKTWLRK